MKQNRIWNWPSSSSWLGLGTSLRMARISSLDARFLMAFPTVMDAGWPGSEAVRQERHFVRCSCLNLQYILVTERSVKPFEADRGSISVLTTALVFVFVSKDGFSWDESWEGCRDDIHYPLVVWKSAGTSGKPTTLVQGDTFQIKRIKEFFFLKTNDKSSNIQLLITENTAFKFTSP